MVERPDDPTLNHQPQADSATPEFEEYGEPTEEERRHRIQVALNREDLWGSEQDARWDQPGE